MAHRLTRWILDRLPERSALEEVAVVAPSSAAARALRDAVIRADGPRLGVHFVTVPGLAQLICERHGHPTPTRRADPLEERALVAAAVRATPAAHPVGPLRTYARRFASTRRQLLRTIREWQLAGRPTSNPEDKELSSWVAEFVTLARDITTASDAFATRACVVSRALQAIFERPDVLAPHRVLVIPRRFDRDAAMLLAALQEREIPCESWRPKKADPHPPETTRISTPDLESELREAAHLCLERAAAGTAWSDLAVAVPRLATYAPLIRRAFAAEGVPFRTAAESPLRQEPRAALATHAARILFGDAPRSSYLALLASPLLREPLPPAELEIFDRTSRDQHFGGRGDHTTPFCADLQRLGASTVAATIQRWLARATELDAPISAGDRAAALGEFLRRTLRTPTPGSRDATADARLFDALEATRRASTIGGDIRSADTDGAFATEFEEILAERGMPMLGARPDGVHLVDYEDAACIPVDHLHICGLVEGMVPYDELAATLAILSDDDREALSMPNGDDDRKRQRLAVSLLARHPTTSVVLSAPRRGPDGRPATPSPWLDGLDLPTADTREVPAHPLDRAAQRSATGACPPDLALLRVAFEADSEAPFAQLAGGQGARIYSQAHALERFEPTSLARDGDLGADHGARLAAESLQITRLETLGRCPQQHLFAHVLGLRPLPPEPDPCELPRDRLGTRIHAVLERLFAEFSPQLATATSCAALFDPMAHRARALLDEELRRERGPLRRDFPTLHTFLEQQWTDALDHALRADLARMDQDGSRPLEVEQEVRATLQLSGAQGQPLALTLHGRIDRVDQLRAPDPATSNTDDPVPLRVIDFKTGRNPDKSVDGKEALQLVRAQLPAYAVALQALGKRVGETCVRAIRPLDSERQPTVEFEYPFKYLNQLRTGPIGDGFRETLAIGAELRLRGAFVAAPADSACAWCDFRTACRRLHPPSQQRVQSAEIPEVQRFRRLSAKNTRSPLLDPPAPADDAARGGDR